MEGEIGLIVIFYTNLNEALAILVTSESAINL